MDYLLLIAGLFMMYRRNYPWLFAIIMVLSSTYLQLPLTVEMQMMVGPEHNVADTGLLLFLVFWVSEVVSKGFYTAHPMSRIVLLFLLFLLFNGLIDILNGVSVGDIVRYLKSWAYLLIVFVRLPLHLGGVQKTIKILFWITFAVSVVLIAQYLTGAVWLGYTTEYKNFGILYTRGAKPPSFAVLCCCLAFLNVFKLSGKARIITCLVLFLPIIFCMKMSYFTTICLVLAVCYRFKRHTDVAKIFKYTIFGLVGLTVLFSVFPVFYQRFQDTVNQAGLSSSNKEKGNFSYRIDHFNERLDYVLQDPVRAIRGMGYVQERNFYEKPFKYGLYNERGGIIQLDTGDIAWSLLILRLGTVGLFFYFIMYGRCLHMLWKVRKRNELYLLYFSYMLVSLVFMSFGNALIAYGDFFIIPFLICSVENENSALHMEP